MKLIHGGKAKNDRLDAYKIAHLLRGGNFPLAYAYPQGMRETRDLLRRRMYLVHKRAELITHLEILNAQNNLPPFGKKLIYAANRAALNIPERFSNPSDRAGEPDRRTEAAWDERRRGCCKQPNVGDCDPAMHPCASAGDLVRWIGPWPGSALTSLEWNWKNFAPRLPLAPYRPRTRHALWSVSPPF
jgi:hypothetical protein